MIALELEWSKEYEPRGSDHFPISWKQVIINPLLKKRKNPKDVRSYRPVALTNILCKIFENMTNKRLAWYLEKEKKIDNRQFGFKKQMQYQK